MSFDAAQGFLIGEPNRGLAAMFVMMNSARLNVGMQGLGHAEMAYQNALRYAGERRQMRAVSHPPGTVGARASGDDSILLQPAIRRALMTLQTLVEGEHALGYWSAHLLDMADNHPDRAERARAHASVSLLTPIVKSFFTENGFSLTSTALQVWGGYGYVHDYGIEQSERDSRVAMIYEGTNEIQAIDLLVRKVIGDSGRNFDSLLTWVRNEADLCATVPGCVQFGETLLSLLNELTRLTRSLIDEAVDQPEIGYRAANDFLRLVALLPLGCWWARAARVAAPRVSDDFYMAKWATAVLYFDYLMPETAYRLALLERRRCPLPWL